LSTTWDTKSNEKGIKESLAVGFGTENQTLLKNRRVGVGLELGKKMELQKNPMATSEGKKA